MSGSRSSSAPAEFKIGHDELVAGDEAAGFQRNAAGSRDDEAAEVGDSQALAAIHRADAHAPGLTYEDQLVEWRQRLDAMGDTTATFEWGFRWLAAHRPEQSPTVLVHGDFRMGNLIVDGSDLAAVLDWELVHVGHAYEDLAWFCIRAWRFGAPASQGAGGLGSIENFLVAYEQASATTVDRVAFHWWLVLATLRWGVMCTGSLGAFRSVDASVERAMIARRKIRWCA